VVLAAQSSSPDQSGPASAKAPATEQRVAQIENARKSIAAGAPDAAVKILKTLVAADPKDADAQLLLGMALALVPRRSEALEVLHHAVELQPDSAAAYLTLGSVLARFSETGEACQAFQKALALDRHLAAAHANLAVIFAARGDLASAASHLSEALDDRPDGPDAARYHYLRGKVYRQQDLLRKAEKDFEAAVQLRPGEAKAYLELGMTRADLRDESGALQALRKAVQLSPNDAEARYQLGSHYLDAGDAQRAAEHLGVAARLMPHDREVVYALTRALRAAGRMEEAAPLIEQLSREAATQALHDPDVLKAGELNNAGIALEKEGNFAAALEKYRAAVAISPQEIRFRKNLALALCRLERWEEAIVELRVILQASPGDPEATKTLYIALDKVHDGR
jgi:Flp pilus assembly protein TadD